MALGGGGQAYWYRLRIERTAVLRPVARALLSVTAAVHDLRAHNGDGQLSLSCSLHQLITYLTPQGQLATVREVTPCGVSVTWPGPDPPERWQARVERAGFWLEPNPGRDWGERAELDFELLFGSSGADAAGGVAPLLPAVPAEVRLAAVPVVADRILARARRRFVVSTSLPLSRPLTRVVDRQDRVTITACQPLERGVIVNGRIETGVIYETPDGTLASDDGSAGFAELVELDAGCERAEAEGRVVPGSPVQADAGQGRLRLWHVVELQVVARARQDLELVTEVQGPGLETVEAPIMTDAVVGRGVATAMAETTSALPAPGVHVVDVRRGVELEDVSVTRGGVAVAAVVWSHVHYQGAGGLAHHCMARTRLALQVPVEGALTGHGAEVDLQATEGEVALGEDGGRFRDRVVVEAQAVVFKRQLVSAVTAVGGPGLRVNTVPLWVQRQVGSGRLALLQEGRAEFERPPRALVDSGAEAEVLRCEVLTDRVLCHGVVSFHLYYVDHEGLEQYHGEAVPFSTMVEVPGARPGMLATVRADASDHVVELGPGGTAVDFRLALTLQAEVALVGELAVVTGVQRERGAGPARTSR